MRTGAWTVTCLLLAALAKTAPALPADVFPISDRRLEFPIKVDPSRKDLISRLELYMSADQGRTWEQVGSALPDQTAFTYPIKADGEFWFTIIVVDRQNRREPPAPSMAPVDQKILVDTLKPDVKLRADRQGDVVNVNWDIREENADLSTFRLEWRPSEGNEPWNQVQAPAGLTGRGTIRASQAIMVRAELRDVAKNVGSGETNVAAAAVLTASTTALPAAGVEAAPVAPVPGVMGSGTAVERNKIAIDPGLPVLGQDGPKAGSEPVIRRTSAGAGTLKPGTTGAEEIAPPALPPGVPASPAKPDSIAVASPSPMDPVKKPEEHLSSGSPVPTLPDPPGTTLDPKTPVSPTPPARTAPEKVEEKKVEEKKVEESPAQANLQVINTRRVTMEYEVMKVGSSGIGSVDVYMTRDDGMVWKLVKGEHQALSGDTAPGVMRRTVTLDLNEDGIYGFSLVAKSGAGMSQKEPHSGDTPQMRVKLDTVLPEAILFRPKEDSSHKDCLLLSWKATDQNLTTNPVTIQWAEKPSGPWEYIGGPQLANQAASNVQLPEGATGAISWEVPSNAPAKVYLRLTVRDLAGNTAVAETSEPVQVDFSKPVTVIRGLVGPRGR